MVTELHIFESDREKKVWEVVLVRRSLFFARTLNSNAVVSMVLLFWLVTISHNLEDRNLERICVWLILVCDEEKKRGLC